VYQKAALAGLGAAAADPLAFTGFHVVYFVLAGFALLAAGLALSRISPRRHDKRGR
jgi:hypothetical protein